MSLFYIIFVIAFVWFVVWLIQNYVPMDPKIKNLLSIVVVFLLVLWCLDWIGLLPALTLPRHR
jgi:hypothetical protein